MPLARLPAVVAAAAALVAALAGCGGPAGEPFLEEVLEVTIGEHGGFGDEGKVLGPPRGGGELSGSLDVLSLGRGGSITARLGTPAIDGEGADLIVFENAFRFSGGLFREPGQVLVSADGETWVAFGCAPDDDQAGCAGQAAVFAHPDNALNARDPDEAGGDAFDLAEVGLDEALYVRIDDRSSEIVSDQDNAGFDLDAVAAVHTYFD